MSSRAVFSRTAQFVAAVALGAAALTGCGNDSDGGTAAPASTPASTPAAPLTITDPWVKTADEGMTAAFGTLTNTTGAELTIVSGATPASPKVELHEVAGTGGEMKMRPREGGFTIPAGGRLELKPGGFHIMLMGVTKPIKPGDQVAFTLTLKDGTTFPFTALGKAFKGGNEKYVPGH
ncbi:hypothetical protein DPM19_01320 [Actinomadura craniellae]|uniref:Copper chaperone PCu(A)C n=1 Tax=Actinomadura craniellae TaxID=2231787 RepID=A0A365HCG5_9ACTN|nr:copper chaperone PCu(A)C [Actinomadura craniellae]RAY16834.1 hypothetical protein DPM19_01320 [Actinomadura craniellae]